MNLWNTLLGKILMTLLISMIPVLELRGAIPIAVANGLDFHLAVLVSLIGNLLPTPFIIVFIRKIFEFVRRIFPKLDGFITNLEERAEKKSEMVKKYTFWGLFILVAVPLPGTGAWTGALIAATLNMRVKTAMPPIILGVITAALIVTIVTYGAGRLLF